MRIGELASVSGIPPETVRFYERRGLLPRPRREPNGYRHYNENAPARIQFIRAAQTAGLTLAEIRSIIDLRDGGTVPCVHVETLLQAKLTDVRARRQQLSRLERDLALILEHSHRLDPANCSDDNVCHILTDSP